MFVLGLVLTALGGFCIGYSFAVEAKARAAELLDIADNQVDQKMAYQYEILTMQQTLDSVTQKGLETFQELEELKASINKEQEAALKVLNKELGKPLLKKKANVKKVSFSKKKERK